MCYSSPHRTGCQYPQHCSKDSYATTLLVFLGQKTRRDLIRVEVFPIFPIGFLLVTAKKGSSKQKKRRGLFERGPREEEDRRLFITTKSQLISPVLPRYKDMDIENFSGFDAFADAEETGTGDQGKVHIRVQQRNGRKCITLIEGLAEDLDVKRICKAFKKNFSCNGAITKDADNGEIIQLSGDQRTNTKDFLVDQEICTNGQIVIHGF